MMQPETLLQNRYQLIQLLGDTGFGQTWVVKDQGTEKILKVLQVPPSLPDQSIESVVALFQQEAEVLSQIHHPGLPQVEPDGYFTLKNEDNETLHCLVMEKVHGVHLEDWLQQRGNQPIDSEQAIVWLKQVINILDQLHQHQCIHQDIKPYNIMVRTAAIPPPQLAAHSPSPPPHKPEILSEKSPENSVTAERAAVQKWGQLVLINLGSIRAITETYLRDIEGKEITDIISPGYTSLEQSEGKVLRQSDFFALGRTWVYLLTGKNPTELPINPQTNRLLWREVNPSIPKELADLIDKMMANLPQCRPQTTQDILERIIQLEADLQKAKTEENPPHSAPEKPKKRTQYLQKIYPQKTQKTPSVSPLNPQKLQQKNSLFLLAIIGGIIYLLPDTYSTCPLNFRDHLSCGEEILIPGPAPEAKEKGVKAFTEGNFNEAVKWLRQARQEQINDPETLIYLNNARIAAQQAHTYTIAVALPLGGDSSSLSAALEMLRGVAQAQDAINQEAGKIRGKSLRIILADDQNDSEEAVKRAEDLALIGDIMGVVGHFSSGVTLKVAEVYKNNQLVLVSPTSTAVELSTLGDFMVRTVPSDAVTANALAGYGLNSLAASQNVAVFHNPKSAYSASLYHQFLNSFGAGGGKVIPDQSGTFEFSPNFDAGVAIETAQKQKATALVILPDSATRTDAIQVIKASEKIHLPLLGGDSVYNNETLTLGAEQASGRLVVATPWTRFNSPNPLFPKQAKELWGKGTVSWRTALSYDATRVLITALEQRVEPTRKSVEQVLKNEDFRATGATGEIRFLSNGDRKESKMELVKVVKSECAPSGYMFVPLTAAEGEYESLECD